MQRFLLVSILAMTIVLPTMAAREPRPRLALRRTVWWMLAGLVAYVLAVALTYARLGG